MSISNSLDPNIENHSSVEEVNELKRRSVEKRVNKNIENDASNFVSPIQSAPITPCSSVPGTSGVYFEAGRLKINRRHMFSFQMHLKKRDHQGGNHQRLL